MNSSNKVTRPYKRPHQDKTKRDGTSSRKSDVTSATDILNSVLSRYGLAPKIEEYRFVAEWGDIVGAEIAKRSRPEGITRGTLTIRVCGSAWAQELSFHKDVIISRIGTSLGDREKVKDIRFIVDSTVKPIVTGSRET